jgi:RNA polymerase sigma-70 factor (ECF subfamily)
MPVGQRVAFGMLQNAHETEDALQEAILKCWRARYRVREGSDLRPWFLTVVANECRQRLRSRWWSVRKTDALPDNPAISVNEDDAVLDLRTAIRRLPSDMRTVLVLRYYVDLGFEEMGRVLRCSPQAAKSRAFRALQRLKTEIPKELGE